MKAIIGTRKGLFILEKREGEWQWSQTHFEGVSVNYVYHDAAGRELWAGINHGHWGPKLHRSTDGGESFEELGIPNFPEDSGISFKGFWNITRDTTGRIYAGAEPGALFHSDDDGEHWNLNQALFNDPHKDQWFGAGTDESCLHSLLIHPEHPEHLLIGISVAGVLISKDRGKSWDYSSEGLKAEFLPDPSAPVGQDPHLIAMGEGRPNVLLQQNHCGLYRSTNFGESWQELNDAPGLAGWFGWACAISGDGTCYTVPALSDENRVCIDGALFVQRSSDDGQTWQKKNSGLPQKQCYDICYRHALSAQGNTVMFGTTNGNLYISEDKAQQWQLFSAHLPPIYFVSLTAG